MPEIQVKVTPPDLLQRMAQYPRKLDAVMRETTRAALLIIWEHVPPYPRQPAGSRYIRKGRLGGSLGTGQTGGKLGQPDILTVKKLGATGYEGTFGSNLSYAADVIGPGSQKPIHRGRWWTTKTIATRAAAKVVKVYEIAARRMTLFLDGKA